MGNRAAHPHQEFPGVHPAPLPPSYLRSRVVFVSANYKSSLLLAIYAGFPWYSRIKWYAGSAGRPRPTGTPGREGVKGQIGDKGSQGMPGPRGDRGREGPPGKSGPRGIKGIKGQQGLVGMKGEPGIAV